MSSGDGKGQWRPASRGRECYEHPAGFLVVRPIGDEGGVPLECPVCGLLMRQASDVDYYMRSRACSDCAVRWAEGHNRERWDVGWRPSAAEIEERAAFRRSLPFVVRLD